MKILVVFGCLLASWSCNAVELIAHRANAKGAVENSLAGVEASWASGADAIEIDVRVSKDAVVYLYHDDEIDERVVSELTHAEMAERTSAEQVPRLESVLDMDGATGSYLLDLKSFRAADIELLADVVLNSRFPSERIIIQSDNLAVLGRANEALPDCQYFYLDRLRRTPPFYFRPGANQIVEKLAGQRIHGVSIKGRRTIDSEYVEFLRASGLTVYVWTINNIGRIEHYRRIGADGIITDFVRKYRKAAVHQ